MHEDCRYESSTEVSKVKINKLKLRFESFRREFTVGSLAAPRSSSQACLAESLLKDLSGEPERNAPSCACVGSLLVRHLTVFLCRIRDPIVPGHVSIMSPLAMVRMSDISFIGTMPAPTLHVGICIHLLHVCPLTFLSRWAREALSSGYGQAGVL